MPSIGHSACRGAHVHNTALGCQGTKICYWVPMVLYIEGITRSGRMQKHSAHRSVCWFKYCVSETLPPRNWYDVDACSYCYAHHGAHLQHIARSSVPAHGCFSHRANRCLQLSDLSRVGGHGWCGLSCGWSNLSVGGWSSASHAWVCTWASCVVDDYTMCSSTPWRTSVSTSERRRKC